MGLNITHITSTATTIQAKAEKTKSFLKKKIPTFRDVKKEKKDEDSEKKAEDSKKKIIQLQIDSLQKTSNETLSDVTQKLANSTKFIKGEFKKNLTAEEKKKNCKSLNDIIGNSTDFDINVSKLRTDFMTYTKQFLKKSLQMEDEKNKQKILEEKETSLLNYSKKMNELNGLLQQYKLELYQLKNKEECENKSKNYIKDIETSFLSLFGLLKDEMKDSKIEVSFIMINLNDSGKKSLN